MACILYKDGERHDVEARFVPYMLKNGYTSEPAKTAKAVGLPVHNTIKDDNLNAEADIQASSKAKAVKSANKD